MAGVSHIVANELYDKGVRRTKRNASSTATFVMTKRGVGDRRDKNDKIDLRSRLWRRRILIGWEHHAQNFLGFVELACLIVPCERF